VANIPGISGQLGRNTHNMMLFNAKLRFESEIIQDLAPLSLQGQGDAGYYSSAGARKNTLTSGNSVFPDWLSLS
jgi:hypothetical protein